MTDKKLLLCCDLDRTVLPNGHQNESKQARPLLRRLAEHPDLTLAYVSGRDRSLLLQAIDEFSIPSPDFAIGDVGTTLYRVQDGQWHMSEDWAAAIAPDWNGLSGEAIAATLRDIDDLHLQEPEKQNRFKLSYYAPVGIDPAPLLAAVDSRLLHLGVRANLIWSIDEIAQLGLLDILPRGADKLHAIRFLMAAGAFAPRNTVFAGDSGNDLPVLTSEIQSVLVANASDDVRHSAENGAPPGSLYVAQGGVFDMNGNYAAGVLEGVLYYLPSLRPWLEHAPQP